ncbi:MAG TPA: hypothetical protein VHB79_10465 [Polyangiaceae bacterium]|nr:hypothetical protein [Polyangiaceae bacterium]
MAGSAADAISPAIERSKQLLFPFKAEKWFALGFTVFMAQCSEGGGGSASYRFPLPSGSGPRPSPGVPGLGPELQRQVDSAVRAFHADLPFWIGFALGVVLALYGLWAFVLWFSSRAKLMFVESVVWDRVDVSAQWTRAGELGFSLFKFRLVLTLGGSLLMLATIGAGVLVALPDWQSGRFLGPQAVIGYSVLGGAALLFGLPLSIALALLDDFVVPFMVVRNVRVGDAWRAFRAEVLPGNIGGLILFYVLRFVLGIAVAIAVAILTCVTCCLTAIPYIGTVVLLPIWVFSRSFSLFYLEQIGVRVFPTPEPSWAQYEQWRFPQ